MAKRKKGNGEVRKEAYGIGKSILHAVTIIKHQHLIKHVQNYQAMLQTAPLSDRPEYVDKTIEDLERFREGINLTGKTPSPELKDALVKYAGLCIEYQKGILKR